MRCHENRRPGVVMLSMAFCMAHAKPLIMDPRSLLWELNDPQWEVIPGATITDQDLEDELTMLGLANLKGSA